MKSTMRRAAGAAPFFVAWLGLCAAGPLWANTAEAAPSPFTAGETLTYEIKWDPPAWMIFLPATYKAGELTLRMEGRHSWQGVPAYKLTADAQSSGVLPKIARITIQDHFETWIDASHCLRKSLKQLREGKRKREVEMDLNVENRTAHLREADLSVQPPKEKRNEDLNNLPACVQDLLSALFVVRLNRFAVNDNYTMDIMDEGRIKTVQVSVQKREYIQVNSVRVPALKVRTTALFGGLFKTGGELIIWVSDDARKVPLKFDARVKYGHVFGFLKSSAPPGPPAAPAKPI